MCKEDGMVMDDGVTARLGPNHFLMTTTTGNAAGCSTGWRTACRPNGRTSRSS